MLVQRMRSKHERIGIGRGGPCGCQCLDQADKTSLLPCLALKSFVLLRCAFRFMLLTPKISLIATPTHSSTRGIMISVVSALAVVVVVAGDSRVGCQTQHNNHIHDRRQVAVCRMYANMTAPSISNYCYCRWSFLSALRSVSLLPAQNQNLAKAKSRICAIQLWKKLASETCCIYIINQQGEINKANAIQ